MTRITYRHGSKIPNFRLWRLLAFNSHPSNEVSLRSFLAPISLPSQFLILWGLALRGGLKGTPHTRKSWCGQVEVIEKLKPLEDDPEFDPEAGGAGSS